MLYLWLGLIAGVLLAYAAMHVGPRRPSAGFLWLGVVVVLMLFIPAMLEFIKMESFDEPHLYEAIRTMGIPWFTSIGLGIWIYLATIPLQRFLRNLRLRLWGRLGPETQPALPDYSREVHHKILSSQRYEDDAEERLLHREAVHPKNEGTIKPTKTTAKASTEAWLSSTAEPDFNYARPYANLLATMLRHAADELDSAVRDAGPLSNTGRGSGPDDRTARFRRAILATRQVSDTVAYFLSQSIEFAEKRNLMRKMEGREDYLAKMASARRAADSKGSRIDATT